MNTERICEQCRQPLLANAPEGLCPACLAKLALGTEQAAPGATININPLAEAAPGTRVPPKPADLAPQFTQLEILELLGMGGMGMVYKARQPRVDRLVALKILPMESASTPSFTERFNREAKALAKLNHPGIVTFYDFGQTSEYYYFIMEYVDGMNLRQLIQAKTLEPRQALELVTQICTALQFAHDEGVVHRDIKPENILLNKKGQVKIADFGLAKLLGAAPDTALTMSQAAMGTFNYMAPEQRENAQKVDHRTDIYSLGVVFYEMLTGEVPMGRFEPPSKKVQVDVRLDEVVLHALEREPARRYQHVSEIKSGVETITSTTSPAPAVPPAGPPPAVPVAVVPATPVSTQPRLSRTAVAGAVCAPWFFLAALAWVPVARVTLATGSSPLGSIPSGPAWWQVVLIIALSLAGVIAPFGTTILGYVALSQIRHSTGRLYGLGLALFDALLFPLLVVDCLVFLFMSVAASPIAYWLRDPIPPNTVYGMWAITAFVAVAGLASVVLDFFIVRKAWRFLSR